MNALISLHNSFFAQIERLGPFLVPTLARLVFVATLLLYFWKSAMTKLTGLFTLDMGAYIQIFPKKMEALGYDPSKFSGLDRLIIFAGTYAEFILPALILVGFFTRIAALGMIVFVFVQTWVDVTGHGIKLGSLFDRLYELIDQRTMWIFLLLVLVIKGAGPLSLDRLTIERGKDQAASG